MGKEKTRKFTDEGTEEKIGEYIFHKDKLTDKVWDVGEEGKKGPLLISFDKEKIYNLWTDYPDNMTEEEVETFDKEKPFWADYFSWRKEDPNWRDPEKK